MLKETIYNLKTQPVMGVVSVLGTALCLLLVMMVTVLNDIDTAPWHPSRTATVCSTTTISVSITTIRASPAESDSSP